MLYNGSYINIYIVLGVAILALILSAALLKILVLLFIAFIFLAFRAPKRTSGTYDEVIAPVAGVVDSVTSENGYTSIVISSRYYDAPVVYSPISGDISDIHQKEGSGGRDFMSVTDSDPSISYTLANDKVSLECVQTAGGIYRSNQLSNKDKSVDSAELIGIATMLSKYEIKTKGEYQSLVKKGDKVDGGRTTLFNL